MIKASFWRYLTVAAVLLLIGLGNLVQIVRIQASPEVAGVIGQGDYIWKTFYPARGEIYDRYGHLLAGNKTVYEVGVDLTAQPKPDFPTITLAAQITLGLDPGETLSLMMNAVPTAQYVVLADYVPADKAQALMDLQELSADDPNGLTLDAVGFKAHLMRSYPEDDLAATVLGFVTRDNHGYLGVEEKYDSVLAGMPVSLLIPADPRRALEYPHIPAGQTLVLTLDRELQSAVEGILDEALDDTGASSGTIVVMDPRNGEILAMASTPRLNLNNYTQINELFPGATPYNRAISQAYEPGSVVKILTMAAALDTNTIRPDTTFFDTGVIVYGGWPIYNWDRGAWGTQDMTGCLAHSLNVCLAWVSTTMGNDPFYMYMQRFGLGHPTGIDLAGEVPGRLKLPGDDDWYAVDLATNAFGQGVAITPLQLMMAASSIANQGQMVYPHVLLAQVQDGRQRFLSPQIVGTPISADTARTLSEMLAIGLEAESSEALVEGYRIAGKTGTAQIPEIGGYDERDINASFIGWGPVDDPQFMVYVWLEKPQTNRAASVVAAPIFRQVVEKTIVLLGIPPDAIRLQIATGQ
jgi:cell division protein FtsI/penicillin-binding protein 2